MMSDLDGLSSIPQSIKGFSQEPNPNPNPNSNSSPTTNPAKRKRNLPGTPDPDAEVIALSPKSLMATNRFLCEICNKGFQRDQNLQLHRRGHNLPWKLKQRTNKEVKKKVYICPEKSCVHHHPSRALGDLTGIKKHFSRKHGEKKWKCDKCSKKYAVQSDWKAHSKICGTREYKCDCGTIFSRKDSFITHRAFCDALAEESARFTTTSIPTPNLNFRTDQLVNGTISNLQAVAGNHQFPAVFRQDLVGLESASQQLSMDGQKPRLPLWLDPIGNSNANYLASSSVGLSEFVQQTAPANNMFGLFGSTEFPSTVLKEEETGEENKGKFSGTTATTTATTSSSSLFYNNQNQNQHEAPAHMSATALLQKAAQMGSSSTTRNNNNSPIFNPSFGLIMSTSSSSSSPSPSSIPSFSSLNQISRNELNIMNTNGGLLLLGDHHHMMMNSSSASRSVVMGNSAPSLLMGMPNSGNQFKLPGSSCNELAAAAAAEHSMTRDFLGVGGGTRGGGGGGGDMREAGRPLLQQQLAKFASLGAAPAVAAAAIDFSRQYSGSH